MEVDQGDIGRVVTYNLLTTEDGDESAIDVSIEIEGRARQMMTTTMPQNYVQAFRLEVSAFIDHLVAIYVDRAGRGDPPNGRR